MYCGFVTDACLGSFFPSLFVKSFKTILLCFQELAAFQYWQFLHSVIYREGGIRGGLGEVMNRGTEVRMLTSQDV